MDELFQHLEARIRALIQNYDHLKQSNNTLNHSKSLLMHEKELLLAKNKMAISYIENMVTRLKSIEKTE